jgi:hypothetical protein
MTNRALFLQQVFEKIELMLELPSDPENKEFWLRNFVKQAVEDKLAHLSQDEL